VSIHQGTRVTAVKRTEQLVHLTASCRQTNSGRPLLRGDIWIAKMPKNSIVKIWGENIADIVKNNHKGLK
jgi:hypothetical protein